MATEYTFQGYVIRQDMMEALEHYLQKGRPTGGFLRAVLAHDLMAAVQHADRWNLPNLPAYAGYMYNEIPHNCHGSYEIVDRWIAQSDTSVCGERRTK
jgi:hypothetical protein